MEEVIFYHLANHKSLSVQNHIKTYHFKVDRVLDLPPKGDLRVDVVYRVRRYHLAIDTVGIFKHKRHLYLLFFQIPKCNYQKHRSKLTNLMESRLHCKGYQELTPDCPSICQYYRNKINEEGAKTTYVYISIETIYDLPNSYMHLREEAELNNIRYAVLNKSSTLLLDFNCQPHGIMVYHKEQ